MHFLLILFLQWYSWYFSCLGYMSCFISLFKSSIEYEDLNPCSIKYRSISHIVISAWWAASDNVIFPSLYFWATLLFIRFSYPITANLLIMLLLSVISSLLRLSIFLENLYLTLYLLLDSFLNLQFYLVYYAIWKPTHFS